MDAQDSQSHAANKEAASRKPRNVVVDFIVYLLVRTLFCVLQALPESHCVALSHGLAWVFSRVLRFRHTVIEDNLRHAFPTWSADQRKQVEREMWQHLMMLICEIALARRKIHETNWREHVDFHGSDVLVSRQLREKPLVIVTSHLGNFEISGYVAGMLGFPNVTVARPLDNPFLHRFLVGFRESTGQYIISSRGTAELAQSALGSGKTLAILGDHYAGPKGCWVEFLNRPASCHKSVALFALTQRTDLVVFNTCRTDRLLHFEMVADVEVWEPDNHRQETVTDVTLWYNRKLESAIVRRPGQYWWLHRRWKDTRQISRQRRRQDRAAQVGPTRPKLASSSALPTENA